MCEPRYPQVVVRPTDAGGNPFVVIGLVRCALRDAGIDPTDFLTEAPRADYEAVLVVARRWVTVAGAANRVTARPADVDSGGSRPQRPMGGLIA